MGHSALSTLLLLVVAVAVDGPVVAVAVVAYCPARLT
jgi:hypothetical protein